MAIGNILHFWNLVKEIDPSDIAEAAERLPRVEIDADPALTAAIRLALTDGATRAGIVFPSVADGVVGSADLVIEDSTGGVVRRVAPRIVVQIDPTGHSGARQADPDRTIVTVPAATTEALRAALVPAVLARLPDYPVALGRHFPPFRPAAARSIIRDAARANAEFAALSNLPALVPVIGGVIGSAADFIILTKNQILMLLKLATIYDRDSRHGIGILKEILPIVGAGLAWRTVARELAGLLPFAAGAIPKIAIAFVGTYVAGMSALYYYQEGRAAPKEVLRSFQLQAVEMTKSGLARLPGRAPGSPNGHQPPMPH